MKKLIFASLVTCVLSCTSLSSLAVDTVAASSKCETKACKVKNKGEAAVVECSSESQLKKVLEGNDRVVVDYYTPFCGPCKRMAPVFASVAESTKDVTFVKVNLGEHTKLGELQTIVGLNADVISVPTFVTFVGGKEVQRKTGAIEKNILTALAASGVSKKQAS